MIRRLFPVLALTACGGDETFLIVTVQSQPAVHDVSSIEVELDNEGTTRGDTFEVDSPTFPATFSVSAPGRTGALTISLVARDEEGLLVGRGSTTTMIDAASATVLLDSADFVVNTDFADDQFPSNDFESHGFQLGADANGTWTAVYRDGCMAPCNMFARRFDVTGAPIASGLAAGTNGFAISTELSDGFFTTPATATVGGNTIAVWNFSEPPPSTTNGIACRAMDSAGNGVGDQVTLSVEISPFAAAVAPLGNGNFVVTWYARPATANVIRGAIVNPQCQVTGPVDISTVTATGGATRPAVIGNSDKVLYTWVLDGGARLRVMDLLNQQVSTDQQIVAKTATEEVEFVRVAKLGTGFAIFVRWANVSRTGPGRIEMYKTTNTGMLQGTPTPITAKTSSDFQSVEGFSVTSRPDNGSILVAWHSCGEISDESGCGVFGRLVGADGTPLGDEFNLATTTDLDQTSPSVIGLPGAFAALWADGSKQAPDVAGQAVRARVIYGGPDGGSAGGKRDVESAPALFDLTY
jgi:hypothetical protein